MKQILIVPLVTALLAGPLHAEDEAAAPPSLMERGAQLFLEGLMQEMAPALEDMTELLDEAGPALQDFMTQMGPKLRAVLDEVEDWSVYSAPEVLPNGDIIIRRKPDAPAVPPAPEAPQIDL